MDVAFHVYETINEHGETRLRGRVEKEVRVGDNLLFRSDEGFEINVSIIRIETYGKEAPFLGFMLTGDLIVNDPEKRISGIGKLFRG